MCANVRVCARANEHVHLSHMTLTLIYTHQGKAAVPNHNNGVEGLNGADKEYFAFERPAIVRHLARMPARLEDRSWLDRNFGAHVNRKTWNGPFWSTVLQYLSKDICPLFLIWKMALDEEHGNNEHRRVQAFIMPSSETILAVTNTTDWRHANDKLSAADQAKSVKKIVNRKIGGSASWLDTYKHLLTNPVDALNGAKTGGVPWDFSLTMHWMNSFRLLIVVDSDKEVDRLLTWWGNGACNQGTSTPAKMNVETARLKGVVRCRCGEYLLRGMRIV